jgi:hypothetical protein
MIRCDVKCRIVCIRIIVLHNVQKVYIYLTETYVYVVWILLLILSEIILVRHTISIESKIEV